VIVPNVKKGAFIIGAKYGRGFIVCRTERARLVGSWRSEVEGGSVGFQIADPKQMS